MRFSVLLGRLLYSLIFLMAAPNHFSANTISYASSMGVPAANFLVPFSGLMILLGGLSVLLGYKIRVGSWLLLLFLIPVTFTMHAFWREADPMMMQIQQVHFMKNISLMGGALAFFYFGAGAFSLDSRLSKNKFSDFSMKGSGPLKSRTA